MRKQVGIAAVLLFATGAVWPTVTQARQHIHHQGGKPPPTVPLPPIKLPLKPTPAHLQSAVDRINASPTARQRLASALASHDDRAIAAIFKSVHVDVPGGMKFIPAAIAKPNGGSSKDSKGQCYVMKIVAYKDSFPIVRLTPVRCPQPVKG
jgi:hypothetical protein